MTPRISEMIQAWREDPDTSGNLSLIVGVEEGSSETAIEAIEEIGANVEKKLGYDYLRVSDIGGYIDELEDLDIITSIEIETSGTTLEEDDKGNSNSPVDLTH